MDSHFFHRIDFQAVAQVMHFAAKRAKEDRILQIAASLTFTSVLSMVPLFAVAFALFTAFPIFNTFRDALQEFLLQELMPVSVNDQIFFYLNQFASKAKGMTAWGLISLMLTSIITLITIESTFNLIWRVPCARPLLQRILVYWGLLTVGPLLFGASLSISSYIFSQTMSFVDRIPIGITWMLSFLPLAMTSIAFTLMYIHMPNCKVDWRDALAGGGTAAVAFEIAKYGFGCYVRKFPTYAAIYGAFAAFPIFLLWIYVSWLVTLLGAMVASILPSIRQGHFQYPRFPGRDLNDSLVLLHLLSYEREYGRSGKTRLALAQDLGISIEHVSELLIKLEHINWIGRLSIEGSDELWILLANPKNTSLGPLVTEFLLDVEELIRQLSRYEFDGKRVATKLRNGHWDVLLSDILPRIA
ncbi:YihY family inner membrane protein [Candidatus Pandoraea novymonadis]|uniref:UPF0761 membrane protein BZL35_00182 n=1 Tax=Candidatus Pandoraea novymonadis TaxID=1808959 RepID=A0ABX5FE51_9BURK|nr:YihY family inner membrane protein [Candidatus Pandoraea novymonadis]PSB91960.1 hypothetical protein BZL35_00182 [Candidatus Pandoraea novymonadis]